MSAGAEERERMDGRTPPGWLTALAEAGARMEVPPIMRPPAAGGRRSAVLVLFGSGASGGNPTLDPYLVVGGILAVSLAFGLPMIGAHERG